MSLTPICTQLKLLNNSSDSNQSRRYYRYAFAVPKGCGRITLSLDIETNESAQIPIVLFDAKGKVRIMRAANATTGKATTRYFIMPSDAEMGCIPGLIPEGEWKLILYKRRMFEDIFARLTICMDATQDLEPQTQVESPIIEELKDKPFSRVCMDCNAGWYCGELHTHSDQSTGYTTLEAVVDEARNQKLDFLAVTDHFTASHWLRLQRLKSQDRPLLLQSMEISGDYGHANVHGLRTWQNPLVDNNQELTAFLGFDERQTMEVIANETHRQGGLFCINHALSGIMGWRYREFPIEKADMYEVFSTPELQTSMLYPTHWDLFLLQGLHLTGVGSSDSHHPTNPGPWKLGVVRTWVYADSLSQKGILKALKKGHAYVGIEGAQMDMYATCAGKTAYMGDTLEMTPDDEAEITIHMPNHPMGNLFIYADGMIMDTIFCKSGEMETYRLTLPEKWIAQKGESYIRMEFHELKSPPEFHGLAFRDHLSARLISNPIWLKRKEK